MEQKYILEKIRKRVTDANGHIFFDYCGTRLSRVDDYPAGRAHRVYRPA